MTWLGYLAMIPLKAGNILKEALEKEDMWSLYEDIELPLSFSLYRMEVNGIQVEKDALKEYGDHLVGGRILELSRKFMPLPGKNSIFYLQNSWALFFLINCICLMAKTKTGYSTSASVLKNFRMKNLLPVLS